MVIDSPALVAILLDEPGCDALFIKLSGAERPVICAANGLRRCPRRDGTTRRVMLPRGLMQFAHGRAGLRQPDSFFAAAPAVGRNMTDRFPCSRVHCREAVRAPLMASG
jgi:hypothetical protein